MGCDGTLKIIGITAPTMSEGATAIARPRVDCRDVTSANSGITMIHVGRTRASRHSVAPPQAVSQALGGDEGARAKRVAMTIAPAW